MPENSSVYNSGAKAREVKKEFELPSGRKAVIYKGTGKNARIATTYSNGDQGMLINSLMSQLCEIDGKQYVPEELEEELDLQDYMILQGEFSLANFS